MGLCLYILDRRPTYGCPDPVELAECDVGAYSDFGAFRDLIAKYLEADLFPILMEHSDCDGEWSLEDIPELEWELREIATAFKKLPAEEPVGGLEFAAKYRVGAKSLYDCVHVVGGRNTFEALLDLCAKAREFQRPITFY
ncbi:MAG TPA: Imm70 family immunity protein [Gemmataceae bacterium]